MTAIADREAVLFANEAFYRAFCDRDIEAMDRAWGRVEPVLCIHPGWPPLNGRDAVMASWTRILVNPQAPRIACVAPRAFVWGDTAMVVCHEDIQGQALVATNLFRREKDGWKLVHHQASPAPGLPEPDPDAPPQRPN
ncbi:MAG: nuclear transport factor 2 family protein [Alphaproteobacteria bacterium]